MQKNAENILGVPFASLPYQNVNYGRIISFFMISLLTCYDCFLNKFFSLFLIRNGGRHRQPPANKPSLAIYSKIYLRKKNIQILFTEKSKLRIAQQNYVKTFSNVSDFRLYLTVWLSSLYILTLYLVTSLAFILDV